MSNYETEPLPKGWHWTTLGEVAESMKNGIYKPSSAYAEDGMACLRMYNIDEGRIVWRDIKRMRLSEAEIRDYALLPGDLLVNRVNSRELVGKTAAISIGMERSVFESKNIRVRLRREIVSPEFVSYRMFSAGSRYFAQNAQQVVGMASISQPQVARFPLPLPPLAEQRRIVTEIEKQFTRLEAGVMALKQVQGKLRHYRDAVLKAACEGRLVPTEAELAREESRPYEPASELLARILIAHGQNWQGRGKYKEPASSKPNEAGPIPVGWTWVSGAHLFTWSSGEGLTQKDICNGQYPVYGGNGVTGYHNAYIAKNPTLVVGRVGALCGNVYLTDGPAWITDNAIYATTIPAFASMQFIRLIFAQAKLNRKSVGSGQPFVNQRMLNETWIPFPPFSEQIRIMAEVERRLSIINHLDITIKTSLRRSSHLKQSILHKAFAGHLI